MDHECDYLIVGGGMAAGSAAKALRESDPGASVDILGDDSHAPYERPPLSKALWSGDKTVSQLDMHAGDKGAELHLARRAARLDPTNRSVDDNQGDSWQYRRLLLATGSTPRRLALPESPCVIHYRTLDDYESLHRLATKGAHVAVVGSGFIGSELAAALVQAGCKVTMVFPGEDIGAGRFPDSLADFLTGYYRNKGVEMRTGVKVTDGQATDSSAILALSDGSELGADVVVAGLGVTPNTGLADDAGLEVEDGIVVDGQLRSSEPDIWAAGDVANFYNAALDRRLRVEHENAALGMGHLAGLNMAGESRIYDTLPFFYSDLFDLGYEAVGELNDRLEIFEDWKVPFREGVVYYLDDGRVRGVLLWNVWGQVEAARELIAQPGPVDMESLRGRIPRAV